MNTATETLEWEIMPQGLHAAPFVAARARRLSLELEESITEILRAGHGIQLTITVTAVQKEG